MLLLNKNLSSKLRSSLPVLREKGKELFPPKIILSILAGTAISAFGMVNIHQRVQITEGGVLGMILLLNYWFHVPTSLLSPILDALSYAAGFKFLGKEFLPRSIAATFSLAFFLRFWEVVPFRLPDLSERPLLAAVFGACFVGVGVGLIVRQGISSGGDDALALTISRVTGWNLATSYLSTDMMILFLSLSYISPVRIACSVLTVCISSAAIDVVKNYSFSRRISEKEKELSCAEALEKTQEL